MTHSTIFAPALAEQRFVLDHVARIGELGDSDVFAVVSDDLIDAVLDGAGRFAAGEWSPLNRSGDRDGAKWTAQGVRMPQGFVAAYGAYVAGEWGAIGVPEAWGGQGLPFVLQVAVQETLGTANMAFALCPMLTMGAIEALLHHGSEAQKAAYLPKLATGQWTGTMNLTEPQAGSDVGALRTSATARGDGTWMITGTKIFISYGDHDLTSNIIHLVLARTLGAPAGTRGISLFLVPKYRLGPDGTPGAFNDVKVVSIEHKLGLHASPTCVLSFGEDGDCVGELVGAEHGGMSAMFTMMNNARLNVGLEGVQVAEAATQQAVYYARDRIQSARAGSADRQPVAIFEHPDMRRMLLRMKAQTMAARALVYYAAGQVDRAVLGSGAARSRLDLLTPLVKAHAADIANEVASLGIQVHGGVGYIEEMGAAQLFRDARIIPIYEETNGIQAADLVNRKLALEGGAAFADLIAEMRDQVRSALLRELVDDVAAFGDRLSTLPVDDRLAASYPFLTMFSVAVCGWLFERQAAAASGGAAGMAKLVCHRFYIDQIILEALGLHGAATAFADQLYALPADAF